LLNAISTIQANKVAGNEGWMMPGLIIDGLLIGGEAPKLKL
jgi:hypothetical protein